MKILFIDMKAIKPTERWMKNVSFRCTAPIWMTRQLVKHAVMMAWNEVSRRYVSSIPEMFAQELRLKAENVKQGSGGVARHVPDVYCENDNHSGWFDVNDINDAMLRWYEAGVNPDGECHLAPETVRGFLPLNMMTTWIWSGPVPTFDHVVRLRDEAHSQKETQDFGKKLKAVL